MVTIALAILGVIGTLVGTWLGAWLTARQSERAEARRRTEAAEARQREIQAAARLVYSELGLAGLVLSASLERKSLVGLRATSVAAWAAYGPLLAAELDDEAHAIVAEASTKLASAVAAVETLPEAALALSAGDAELLGALTHQIEDAQKVLHPRAYPSAPAPTAFSTNAER